MKNNKRWIVLYFFAPSLGGVVIYLILSFLSIILIDALATKSIANVPISLPFSYITNYGNSIYLKKIVSSSQASLLIQIIFWSLVGLMTFFIIRALVTTVNDVSDNISFLHYIWPEGLEDKKLPLRTYFERMVVRLVSVIILLFYSIWCSIILFPILLKINPILSINHILLTNLFKSIIIQLLIIHIFTILIRFILLRERILG